jgi:hypothetical protein
MLANGLLDYAARDGREVVIFGRTAGICSMMPRGGADFSGTLFQSDTLPNGFAPIGRA